MVNSVGQGQNILVPNYSGVNIQIFNPSVAAPGAALPDSTVHAPTFSTNPYPANYYMQNMAQPIQPAQAIPPADKKKEKREIVQLTDNYIKNLEMYLNNQKKDVRLMGAKEVIARLQEDESRKDDPALNALVNKMLQDPYQPIKFLAMAALESHAASGNSTTVGLLGGVQQLTPAKGLNSINRKNAFNNEDSLKASKVLLKMSGPTVEKEFEVKNDHKKSHNNYEA